MEMRNRSMLAAAAVASAGLGLAIAVVACSSFDGADPEVAAEGGADGTTSDVVVPSDSMTMGADASGDGDAGRCSVELTEAFPIVGAPAGWTITKANGSVSVATTIFAGVPTSPPAALVASVTVPDAGISAEAYAQREYPGRPTSVEVRHALRIGKHAPLTQGGCSIVLAEAGGTKRTRIYLSVFGSQQKLGYDDDFSSFKETDVSLSTADWNDVDLKVALGVGNQTSVSVTVNSPGASAATFTLPPFVIAHAVDKTVLRCGITYAQNVGSAELAVDDVQLRICP
jgi:hypothetical protein